MARIKQNPSVKSPQQFEDETVHNKYYLLVSDRYMRAKYIAVILLVVFFAFMMIRFSEDISYSNLMYLLRDFNTEAGSSDYGFESISYDEQENMTFSLFRGELAVAGNRTLKMYNARGNETRSYEPGYSDPVLVSSDKYLLAYNVGSTSYSVYTSIARVNSDDAPGEIEAADVNNKGDHLFVCRSKDAKYVVSTFDSSFRPIAEYYKTRYVTSAAIGDDGRVVIASFASDGSAYSCTVEMYRDGSEAPDAEYTVPGIFPVKCGVWSDGGYFVICTDRVLFFDKNGELIKNEISTHEYNAFSETEDMLALSYDNDSIGGSSTVVLFDTKGEMLYNKTINGSVSSLAVSKDNLYALAGSVVYSFDLKNDDVAEKNLDKGGAYLISSGNSCVVCRRDGAEGVDFVDISDDDAVTSVISSDTEQVNIQ